MEFKDMLDSVPKAFRQQLALVYAAHSAKVEPAQAIAWWVALRDYPDDVQRAALQYVITDVKFTPKPAHAVEWIKARVQPEVSIEEEAEQAWRRVYKAMGSVGYRGSVNFGPRTNAVVRSMGWSRLCQTQLSEVPFRKKDFIAAYCSIARHPSPTDDTRHIIGADERAFLALPEASEFHSRLTNCESGQAPFEVADYTADKSGGTNKALPEPSNPKGQAKVRAIVRGVTEGKK